LHDLKTYQRSD